MVDKLDIVSLGEPLLRFSTKDNYRLEQSKELSISVGGTELNVIVALSRLGYCCGWVGKLVNNPVGRFILGELNWHGVDTSAVIWTETGRIGTYYLESGAKPRSSVVVYDRAFSATSTLTSEEINWDYISQAKHLHLTGITAAISHSCRQVAFKAMDFANQKGMTVSLDINYRSKLWNRSEAFDTLNPMLSHINLLLTTLEDAKTVLGAEGDPENVCEQLFSRYGCPWIVLTLGSQGAIALVGGKIYGASGYELDSIDRIGAGDAFAAGTIWGFLKNNPQTALKYGTAMAALKHTIRGDISFVNLDDVKRLVASDYSDVQR